MNFVGYVACYLSILLNLAVLVWCYSKTGVERKSNKIKCVISLVILSALVYLVNVYDTTSIKWLAIYLLMCIMFYINYDEDIANTLTKTFLMYVTMIFSDLLSSLFLMIILKVFKSIDINSLRPVATLLNTIFMFMFFKMNFFTRVFTDFTNKVAKRLNNTIIGFSLFVLFFFWLIEYYHGYIFTYVTLITSVLIILLLLFLSIQVVLQYYKNKNIENEKQQLQVLMHEYESVLNQTSENRHEMLNDLLILRSIADKNSSEFTRTLDGIIRQYDTKKFKKYTSLAKLPTGVKGMIYYKIAFINENEINFDTVVNGVDYAKFEAMDKDLYYKVCKILGILMDNAIDACVDSDKKKLVVSVYTENEDLCVEIDNSYSGIVDKDGIKKKGYTTKGKNHGHGLTILNRIIDETEELEFEQSINDKDKLFTSILKIKL